MAFVNKMDIMGANFYNAVQMMKDRLNANAVPIQLPIGKEDEFKGVIDLMTMKAFIYNDDLGEDITETDIPEDMQELAEEYHNAMVESICETDDELMMLYLEGEEISLDQLKATLRKGVCDVQIIPVLCGTAYRNKGVQKLLDAVIEYMPSPLDIPPIEGTLPESEETDVRHASDEEPFSALAFKIIGESLRR